MSVVDSGTPASTERKESEESGDALQEAPRIGPGDCLGRYHVRTFIGGGGMGEVFAALDPELGRTVALKVIRPDRAKAANRLRLVREAQALARLDHPNVVRVYDAGSDGDRVFVAMELVDGPSLASWLSDGTHGFRDVLARLIAAGRGLAAAHRAGIVHRDFKPQNVVLGKERVVVVDFGLARAEEDAADAEPGPTAALEVDVTVTGDLVGTPSYMAPEQRAAHRATAASDQFAFCVSSWEALHGDRPASVGPAKPTNAAVPRRINDALRRGLSLDPAARWPSMEALLAELGRDRRVAILRGSMAVGVVALAALAVSGLLRPAPANRCDGGPGRIADAWSEPRRRQVEAAFLASRVPNAADTFARVRTGLDAYAASWVTMFGEACRATRVDGRQSDAMLDLRMACLERRRAVLDELTALWARGADADAVEHATDAVRSLGSLDSCADTRSLADVAPPPPEKAAAVQATRSHVDQVSALVAAHRFREARPLATAVRNEAKAVAWPLVTAEATFVEGEVLAGLQDPSAEADFVGSASLASSAHDDRLTARSYVALVGHLSRVQQSAARALLVADLADGLVTRIDDPDLQARLLRQRGAALTNQGRYPDAKRVLEQARSYALEHFGPNDQTTLAVTADLAELARARGDYAGAVLLGQETLTATIARLGADHPNVAEVLMNLAKAARDADDGAGALAYLNRALAIDEKVAGPDSEAAAATLTEIGNAEAYNRHFPEAEASLQRSLAIREKLLGPSHPSVAVTLNGIATVRREEDRIPEALALLERVLAILTEAQGPEHPRVAVALHKIGLTYREGGDEVKALEHFQKALALRLKVLGSEHEMTHFTEALVGESLATLKRCKEARPLLEAAEASLLAQVGEQHVDYLRTLPPQARCDLVEGHPERAASRLERVLELSKDKPHYDITRSKDRDLLAAAYLALGRREEAAAATRTAAPGYEHPGGKAEAQRMRAWLATLRVGAAR